MAEHDDAAPEAESVDDAELLDEETAGAGTEESDADESDAGDDTPVSRTKRPLREWFHGTRGLVTASVVAIVALAGAGGWLGFRLHQDDQTQDQRNLFVQVARQTAINLTTIDHAEIDADIKRVLDSVTGDFHQEYENRSKPFVEVVKKVQSKTEGSITEAGIVSATNDQAQVLVAVAVKTSMAGAPPESEPRRWRMRLTVDKTGDSAKVSKVEFVP